VFHSVLQCVTVCCSVTVCCEVLQCVAVCCSVLQCVAVCCSVLRCDAVCCSVLQCVAVCPSVLQSVYVVGFVTIRLLRISAWSRKMHRTKQMTKQMIKQKHGHNKVYLQLEVLLYPCYCFVICFYSKPEFCYIHLPPALGWL